MASSSWLINCHRGLPALLFRLMETSPSRGLTAQDRPSAGAEPYRVLPRALEPHAGNILRQVAHSKPPQSILRVRFILISTVKIGNCIFLEHRSVSKEKPAQPWVDNG